MQLLDIEHDFGNIIGESRAMKQLRVANLIASDLFGHEVGAFTGATQRRLGRFELSHHGSIFLDEIFEIPAETQVMLLRVLQERLIDRVGGSEPIEVDTQWRKTMFDAGIFTTHSVSLFAAPISCIIRMQDMSFGCTSLTLTFSPADRELIDDPSSISAREKPVLGSLGESLPEPLDFVFNNPLSVPDVSKTLVFEEDRDN